MRIMDWSSDVCSSDLALSPSVALFVAGSLGKRDYRERSGPVAARDSTGFDLAAGASFELGRKARGSLRLGYLHQDYKAAEFEDVSGFLVRGELAYFLTPLVTRSEEHTSELQSLMRISYAVFCLKKKNTYNVVLT